MPERLARTDPFRQVAEVVGRGPYRFLPDERVAGTRVAYARNSGHLLRWGGARSLTAGPKHAHLDRVEWYVLLDSSTAAAALRTGEVDSWKTPTFELLPVLERESHLALTHLTASSTSCRSARWPAFRPMPCSFP